MKKGFLVMICGYVDIVSTFVMICWLTVIFQNNNTIQWVIIIIGFILCFLKMFYWGKRLEENK
jgi:hypothetical protein